MEGSTSIYLRMIDYNSKALTSNGTFDDMIAAVDDVLDTKNDQFIRVSAFSGDVEQQLNIGSQSSGAGAGKILFNPFRITKFADAVSPLLFADAASGKAFKTVEVFFVNARKIPEVRYTYKLVAIKAISWAAASGEQGTIESISFEYGGLIITVYPHNKGGSTVVQAGWNRVKNVSDNDLNVIIT
ncbi:MAG: type VI secretion system tube protein Hcp [Ginsengibacter sp.]